MKRAVWAACLAMSACGDPLKQPQDIEESRVLGARVEVQGDEDRASVAPGETAAVTWLVADPGDPRPRTWAFAVCEAEDVARGIPICAHDPFAFATSGVPSLAPVAFDFTVPLGAVGPLVVLGVVCADGQAHVGVDFASTTCSGADAVQTDVNLYVLVDDGAITNENPDLVSLQLDGAPWPEGVETEPGEHQIALGATDPDGDALQISHFSDAGELERAFSRIDAGSPTATVAWSAPGSAATAHLYFVVRDLRGGVTWITRTLTVTPAAGGR
jgi:hypothetical protein